MDHVHAERPRDPVPPPRRAPAPPRHTLLRLQATCGNAAVQRFLGEQGFTEPPMASFGRTRGVLARDYETTRGGDLANSRVANLAAGAVVHAGQATPDGPVTVAPTVVVDAVVSGNPRPKDDSRERLYPSPQGRKLTKRPDDRRDCAEPKVIARLRRVLDGLHDVPGASPRPVVYLDTENGPCVDCREAITTFAGLYPWADVVVRWTTWFAKDRRAAPPDWTAGTSFTIPHTRDRGALPWPRARPVAEPAAAVGRPTNPFAALMDLAAEERPAAAVRVAPAKAKRAADAVRERTRKIKNAGEGDKGKEGGKGKRTGRGGKSDRVDALVLATLTPDAAVRTGAFVAVAVVVGVAAAVVALLRVLGHL
ncbi:hypothetical protein [Saccharothrix sp. Mg75]|uniref:hypothetical protein n=1 Tax=Saccharothrix sp. Mg75 TaxID=3445357 RepID=UPI003EEED73D